MTPEAKVKKQIKEILLNVKAYYTMPVTGGYGNAGVPDFLVCYRGMFIGIETKAIGNLVTALQIKHLEDIEKAGGISLIINETNVSNLTQLLEIMDEKAKQDPNHSAAIGTRQDGSGDSKAIEGVPQLRVQRTLAAWEENEDED